MLNVNSEIENFVKNLIDMILDHTEDGNIAWNWGEETFRIDYIIDLINDLANMNYKRPYPDNDCAMCSNIIIDKRKVNIENIVVVEKKIVKTLIVCCVTDKRSVSCGGD